MAVSLQKSWKPAFIPVRVDRNADLLMYGFETSPTFSAMYE